MIKHCTTTISYCTTSVSTLLPSSSSTTTSSSSSVSCRVPSLAQSLSRPLPYLPNLNYSPSDGIFHEVSISSSHLLAGLPCVLFLPCWWYVLSIGRLWSGWCVPSRTIFVLSRSGYCQWPWPFSDIDSVLSLLCMWCLANFVLSSLTWNLNWKKRN